MRINPVVVQALMALRGLTPQALANIATVTLAEFHSWLSDTEEGDVAIEFDTQLDILKMLGISGEAPRSDIVHYWTLNESFWVSYLTYQPLDVVLKAFGPAQITFIASQADPLIQTSATSHFALRFQSFMAVLEIKGHPLRQLRFNPTSFENLTWVGESSGVLLAPEHWDHLQPGAMRVNGLTQYLSLTAQADAWQARQRKSITRGTIPAPDPFPQSMSDTESPFNPMAPAPDAPLFARNNTAPPTHASTPPSPATPWDVPKPVHNPTPAVTPDFADSQFSANPVETPAFRGQPAHSRLRHPQRRPRSRPDPRA